MIRNLVLAAALFSTPAVADETFDMFGITTAKQYAADAWIAGSKCKLTGQGTEMCRRVAGARVGSVSVLLFKTRFHDGHFFAASGYSLLGDWRQIKEAFTAKYGEPTMIETSQFKNEIGAETPNEEYRWIFTDGTLVLRKYGNLRDLSEFRFLANSRVPDDFSFDGQPMNF